MLRIVQITADDRTQLGLFDQTQPCFGTAPAALIDGFKEIPDVEIHVISCATKQMLSPVKLAENIWFHQPIIGKWGWGRSMFLGTTLSVKKLIQKINPDIVHGQGTERNCAIAAVCSGRPNLITIHGNMRVHAKMPDNGNQPYYLMAAFLEKVCLKNTNGVVAISKYTEDLIKNIATKSWIIPNAVDARYFDVAHQQQEIPRILFVGSMNRRKNPIGLVRACRDLLKSGKCTIAFAGRGNPDSDYMNEFHRESNDLPGIDLLGHIDRDQLTKELARSSMLILPTFEDNCPMVLLEAMAAGVAVAASRVGGVPEIIDHEVNGLLFDPSNMEEICACADRLISNISLRDRLGASGREKALTTFHPRVIAMQHIKIYREILDRTK
jgi:glycosyltransferase involved in cell wall biosynthesis